jgi:large subunit ribosomal protein LP0
MVQKEVSARKQEYRKKLEQLLQDYKSILIVGADNVGSSQMQQIRLGLRGHGVLLMGKNTMMRKVVRELVPQHPKLEPLLAHIVGNIGFVFTNKEQKVIRDLIQSNKVPAAAKTGVVAPSDVWVPAGPTGLDPGQTSFFQALNIATKIMKGAVEILSDVHLIKKGGKVNASHVSLLAKLDIKPFFYGMAVISIYEDGDVFSSSVLDITADDLLAKFFNSLSILTAVSLRIGVPNLASLPHTFARAFKDLLAIAVAADIDFEEAKPFKEYLKDPAAWAAKHGGSVAAAPAASSAAAPAKKDEPKAKEPEPEPEEDMSLGGGLFGDD